MEAKKVEVEVYDQDKQPFGVRFKSMWKKLTKRGKLLLAILLDFIDLLIGWIPIVNSIWDIITFGILYLMLKNKQLAYLSLIELPLFGLPPFSFIDMILPMATIVTYLDNNLGSHPHHFVF